MRAAPAGRFSGGERGSGAGRKNGLLIRSKREASDRSARTWREYEHEVVTLPGRRRAGSARRSRHDSTAGRAGRRLPRRRSAGGLCGWRSFRRGRVSADAHLARCRDCRRAVALLTESDPLAVSIALESPADGPARETRASVAAGSHGTAGRSGLTKFATTWLPLAAALVVATGLWFAFNRSRQAPQLASAPAQLSARNEPSSGGAGWSVRGPSRSTPSAPQDSSAAGAATSRALAGILASVRAPRRQKQGPRRARMRMPLPRRRRLPLRLWRALAEAFREERCGCRASECQRRGRQARRSPLACRRCFRRRLRAAAPRAGSATAFPPPSGALGRCRSGARRRCRRTRGAGQGREDNSRHARRPAAPQAAAPAGAPRPVRTRRSRPDSSTPAPRRKPATAAGRQQQSADAAGGARTISRPGRSANLNAAPAPAKADERRQADASKREANDSKREANEKSAGGPSNVKSADAFAKSVEEPKSVARAKAAPESPAAAAAVDAASTKSANAASGRKTEAESAASGPGAGAPAARPAADAKDNEGDVDVPDQNRCGEWRG